MRSRNIKPGFFKNEELAAVSLYARLLFIGLWTMADREGRLEKRPLRIKAEIFPYDSLDINGELTVLERSGFVETYVVDKKEYLNIVNFKVHQRPHHTEAKSQLPEITTENKITVNSPLSQREYPPDSLIPDSLIQKNNNSNTTRETNEEIFTDTFAENAEKLQRLYPHANFEAERELCITHYKSQPRVLDPYLVIQKWFSRIAKTPVTFTGTNPSRASPAKSENRRGNERQEAAKRLLERMNNGKRTEVINPLEAR